MQNGWKPRLALGVALAASLAIAGAAPAASGSKIRLFLFDSAAHKAPHAAALGSKLKRDYQLIPAFAAELSDDEVSALKTRAPGLLSVEDDQTYHALAGGTQVTPYGIDMVDAPAAWATTKGSGAKVAVLDTGIDLDHPDHGDVIATESFIVGETVEDGNGHGTHTSGTVAALDNTEGVVGVSPEASLLIGKVLSNAGSGPTSGIAAGIDWAVLNGANVISMSLGGPGFSAVMKASVDAAVAAGVTVIAASGNDGTDGKSYPAAYANSISVGAVDENMVKASFSQFGPTLDLTAPGVNVLSTVPLGTGAIATANWNSLDRTVNGFTGSAAGTVTLPVYFCGIGDGTPGNTCPGAVAGNIAHIRRGTIAFADKAAHALASGAVGLIISNNVPGEFAGTLGGSSPLIAVSATQADGDDLQALGDGTVATLSVVSSDYAKNSGTSMAAPHVSGVAALLYACGGANATPAKVRQALQNSAIDLGDVGRDDLYGYGVPQAGAAVDDLCGGGCRSSVASRGVAKVDVGLLLAPIGLMLLARRFGRMS